MDWLWMALAALVVGISKTSVGGLGAIAVAIFALVMPAKESTAAVLLLLIVGDVVAVLRYRRHADWKLLLSLLPWVLPGLALGAWFLGRVDDQVLRKSIG
ncbi:MAG TPA: sulfite exporter TauE/SafE family protein, partial [Propionibacteriaceae bacterium]|nr:sulfite exporter TauE/SafE family protein [Propionibacteriaceae bacterium]